MTIDETNNPCDTMNIKVRHPDGTFSNDITLVLDSFVIAVFGDSIMWGDGLLEKSKISRHISNFIKSYFFYQNLKIFKTVSAHTGAEIGINPQTLTPYEEPKNLLPQYIHNSVPSSYPTIYSQVKDFRYPPEIVNLILISPIDIAIDSKDNVYVADFGNARSIDL
jgi:hypothetical protein